MGKEVEGEEEDTVEHFTDIEDFPIIRSLIESQAYYLFGEYNKKKDMQVIYDEIDRFNIIKSNLEGIITILSRMAIASPTFGHGTNIKRLNELRIENRKLENEIYFHNEKIALVEKQISEQNEDFFVEEFNDKLRKKIFEKINEDIQEDISNNKVKMSKN